MPASIACATPAGTSTASPTFTSVRRKDASNAAESWARTNFKRSSLFCLATNPKPTPDPTGASKIIQASVFP